MYAHSMRKGKNTTGVVLEVGNNLCEMSLCAMMQACMLPGVDGSSVSPMHCDGV